jgi:hypothetical protein
MARSLAATSRGHKWQFGRKVPSFHALRFLPGLLNVSQHSMAFAFAKKSSRHRPEEKERYYLLPGQGGSSYRRKQRYIIKWSLIVGLIVSIIFAIAVYYTQRGPR